MHQECAVICHCSAADHFTSIVEDDDFVGRGAFTAERVTHVNESSASPVVAGDSTAPDAPTNLVISADGATVSPEPTHCRQRL